MMGEGWSSRNRDDLAFRRKIPAKEFFAQKKRRDRE
jgi:hypothetical protein